MRIAILGLLLAAALPAHAQQPDAATLAEERLTGKWGMVMRDPPDAEEGPYFLDCDKAAVEIRFERTPTGQLIYESEAFGSLAKDLTPEERISRGPVRTVIADPRGVGAILVVQYDGETRLDDDGKPVVWELILVDANTFHWQRADWSNDSFTAPSHRCPAKFGIG